MIWLYTPKKVVHLTHFVAADPWNEGKQATFDLDKCFDGGFVPAHAAFDDESIPHRFAIRSRDEKQHRALPDSLAALWRKESVPADQLPALLRQLEPSLERSDYIRLSTMNPLQRSIRTWGGPFFGVFLILLGVSQLNANETTTGGVMVALGLLAIGLPLFIISKLSGRRKQQASWALSQVAEGKLQK
ncbi:MAG: hypothetical protein H7Y20_03650 [Bryobacteraceae bacterium]|nr:hypothetical protein [Bryobacteraceae bacterium]